MNKFGVLAATLLLGLGGCAFDDGDVPHTAAQKTNASCKADVDRAYLKQNRAYLSEQSTVGTPYSSGGLADVPSAGLSDAFERDQAFDQCVKGAAPATR